MILPWSAIILAGGKGNRMGTEKAFLRYNGSTFIELIAEEMHRVSNDVLILIGTKCKAPFESLLGSNRVRIISDTYFLDNPLGGLLSALDHISSEYFAVVACDSPLVKAKVVRYLFDAAQGHSASVPIWDEQDRMSMEPLCAVYNTEESKRAIFEVIGEPRTGPKRMVMHLRDVRYVPVSELRPLDPGIDSLLNINTPEDYLALIRRKEAHVPGTAIRSGGR